MVTVNISGVNSAQRFSEVEQVVGSTGLYRKGTDERLFINCRRSQADLYVVNLNLIPGIKAEINGDR